MHQYIDGERMMQAAIGHVVTAFDALIHAKCLPSELLTPVEKSASLVTNYLVDLKKPGADPKEPLSVKSTKLVLSALIGAEAWLDATDNEKLYDTQLLAIRALRATGRRLLISKVRGWIPVDVWVLLFDETRLWHLSKSSMEKIARMEGLYMFDKQYRISYIPDVYSYYLRCLMNRAVFKPETSLADRKRIMQLTSRGEAGSHWSRTTRINPLLDVGKSFCYHYGNPCIDLDSLRFTRQEKPPTDEDRVRRVLLIVEEELMENIPVEYGEDVPKRMA